jgi:AraC-like DNA-binding protein
MFSRQIAPYIPEVSHKRIEKPRKSIYMSHIHNHAEILLFLSGEADYNIDGQIFRPSPYDLLFIPPATYHYLIPTSTVTYENYVIGIEPSGMDEATEAKLFSSPLMIHVKEDAELMGFFTRLDVYCMQYSEADFLKAAELLIRELMLYLCYRKETLSPKSNVGVAHIEEIIGYIASHTEEALDAEVIARALHLSKSYVQNLFSGAMHIGLKKYIMQKKIYAAHADIERGMRPSEACEKYGFGDYSSFYRLYKKTFSAPPYRERGRSRS